MNDAAPPPETTVLSDARTAAGDRIDITVHDGVVARVEAHSSTLRTDAVLVDLEGRLVLPALAEPHAHIDKALTADSVPNRSGDLLGAIDGWVAAAAAGRFTRDEIAGRAAAALERLVLNGVTLVRTHVNVGADVGLVHLRAVQDACAVMQGLIDVETVALMVTPLTGPLSAGNRAALEEALAAGVDLVGGCPHLEPDGPGAIDVLLDAAAGAGVGVDLHIDETLDPVVSTLWDLAVAVIERGFPHPVTASHCVSLGMQPASRQREVAALVAEAGITVVALPQTNLFLQGRGMPTATPRGLTAIEVLREAGVRVVAGADNVQDPFNPMGRSDPFETAALLVLTAHLDPTDALSMVANEVRGALGRRPAGHEVGAVADLLAIGAPSVRAAIAEAPHDRIVIRSGRVVATSTEQRSLKR